MARYWINYTLKSGFTSEGCTPHEEDTLPLLEELTRQGATKIELQLMTDETMLKKLQDIADMVKKYRSTGTKRDIELADETVAYFVRVKKKVEIALGCTVYEKEYHVSIHRF